VNQPGPEDQRDAAPGEGDAQPDERYGVSPELIEEVSAALTAADAPRLRARVEPLHPADAADLLEQLAPEERERLFAVVRDVIDPETLSYLDEDVREELVALAGPQHLADAVSELETDDAVDLLEDLDEAQQQEILARLPAPERAVLEQGLTYPEESAGRLMQRDLVAVPSWWTVGEAIDFLRASPDLPDDFYQLFIVDPTHRPIAAVSLSRAMRSKRAVKLLDIADEDFRSVSVTTNQEEVARLFRQYGLVSVPVVDESGRLVGVITVDDVVEVIDEEAEEDMMRLGGVGEDDLYRAFLGTVRSRFSWLAVNLITAVAAAAVIGVFENSIEQLVALAVLMPIVASMGGNAGTQTLTVAVRAIATKELTPANALRFIGKEFLVGSFNGVLFAVLAGTIAGLWFGNPFIGLVLGAAMIVNLGIAGLLGTLVPLGLQRLRVDPAVASGVFVTTATDVVGFFAFLGLATLVLL
jgi:magnesium transporter